MVRRSSSCVLHVAGVDGELSLTEDHTADPYARREEERRMVEVICHSAGHLSGPEL